MFSYVSLGPSQGTFAFRYLLLNFHYGMYCYIVLSYCFLDNFNFLMENHARSVISVPKILRCLAYLEKKMTVIGPAPGMLSVYPTKNKSERPCY